MPQTGKPDFKRNKRITAGIVLKSINFCRINPSWFDDFCSKRY